MQDPLRAVAENSFQITCGAWRRKAGCPATALDPGRPLLRQLRKHVLDLALVLLGLFGQGRLVHVVHELLGPVRLDAADVEDGEVETEGAVVKAVPSPSALEVEIASGLEADLPCLLSLVLLLLLTRPSLPLPPDEGDTDTPGCRFQNLDQGLGLGRPFSSPVLPECLLLKAHVLLVRDDVVPSFVPDLALALAGDVLVRPLLLDLFLIPGHLVGLHDDLD